MELIKNTHFSHQNKEHASQCLHCLQNTQHLYHHPLDSEFHAWRTLDEQKQVPHIDLQTAQFLLHTLQNFSLSQKPLHILEVGSGMGYSSSYILQGLLAQSSQQTHTFVGLESNPDRIKICQHFQKMKVLQPIKIYFEKASALEWLQQKKYQTYSLSNFDIVFVDAVKNEYASYFHEIWPLLSLGGLIIFDNTLLSGRMWHEQNLAPHHLKAQKALQELWQHLNSENIKQQASLSHFVMGDGLAVIKKTKI